MVDVSNQQICLSIDIIEHILALNHSNKYEKQFPQLARLLSKTFKDRFDEFKECYSFNADNEYKSIPIGQLKHLKPEHTLQICRACSSINFTYHVKNTLTKLDIWCGRLYCTDLSFLKDCLLLNDLTIGNRNRLIDISALSSCISLQKLKMFGTTGIHSVKVLQNCPNLTHLYINSRAIHGIDKLVNLKHLSVCNLDNRSIHLISKCSSIQSLEFTRDVWTSSKTNSKCISLHPLQNLDLHSLRIEDMNITESIPSFRNMTSFDIMIGVDSNAVQSIRECTKLREFILNFSTENANDWAAPYTSVNIEPLQNCTVLEKFTVLNAFNFTNIEHLSRCTSLTHVDIQCSSVDDISMLQNCISITHLNLYNTCIIDLSPITSFTNLKSIDFRHTGISDITPLGTCTQLETIYCDVHTSTLNPLKNCKVLKKLYIDDCEDICDISPILTCPLIKLNLYACHSIRCFPLSFLSTLQNLTIWSSNFDGNLKSLSNCINLKYLQLGHCENISDISPIHMCKELTYLCIKQTKVTTLYPFPKIETYSFSRTRVSNIDVLSQCHCLTNVNMNGTDVSDIYQLSNCKQLRTVKIMGLKSIIDVMPLIFCPKLHMLYIGQMIHKYSIRTKCINLELLTSPSIL